MWRRRIHKRKRVQSHTKHYRAHKERARIIIHTRLEYWSAVTGYQYKKVAIRNQRTRWASCSELGNLNFSYKLIFLPEAVFDYIIVHELCHLVEMNHGPRFWALVEAVIPDYRVRIKELRAIERLGWTTYMASCTPVCTTKRVHTEAAPILSV